MALVLAPSQADREQALFGGTIAAFRETFDHRMPFASVTVTSGTQIGAPIPVLAGESYGHVLFRTGGTPATFGSNADGHWYVAVYDASGNLVTQTADQGTTALPASGIQRIALNATITPTVDAMYTVVFMVYLGTGGSPVAPSLTSSASGFLSTVVTGMPKAAVTANASQTTGVAPNTLGSTGSPNDVPYFMLYT